MSLKTFPKSIFIFGIPFMLIGILFLLVPIAKNSAETTSFLTAITIDFVISIPLIYFLLIRKTKIPNTTLVPMIFLGTLLASFAIPEENQQSLKLFKTWVLPILELSLIVYLIVKTKKGLKKLQGQIHLQKDLFTVLQDACTSLFPKKIASFLSTELALFYFALFKWKKTILRKNQFSYHKNGSAVSLLAGILLICIIELFVLHSLLIKWSSLAAWILSILSGYSAFTIIGFIKSLFHRPINITKNTLFIPYGLLAEATIDCNNIGSIIQHTLDLEENSPITKLSPLGNMDTHNLIIHLKEPIIYSGIYGIKKQATALAVFIDQPVAFINALDISKEDV